MRLLWLLTIAIHIIICSREVLYSLRAQDALRRFHQYGLNNIYGIKSLTRRNVAPFPVIHTLDALNSNGTLIGEESAASVYTVEQDISDSLTDYVKNTKALHGLKKLPKKAFPSLSTAKPFSRITDVELRFNIGQLSGSSVRLVEIRKVKRTGGGYPYGPRNFTIAEFMPPLQVKRHFPDDEVIFKTHNYHKKNESVTTDPDDVWAVKRFYPPSAFCNGSLSCRYCLSYWKLQKKFKPFNVYIFCCK